MVFLRVLLLGTQKLRQLKCNTCQPNLCKETSFILFSHTLSDNHWLYGFRSSGTFIVFMCSHFPRWCFHLTQRTKPCKTSSHISLRHSADEVGKLIFELKTSLPRIFFYSPALLTITVLYVHICLWFVPCLVRLSEIITALCSWPCRALWAICPAGSLPWSTGI